VTRALVTALKVTKTLETDGYTYGLELPIDAPPAEDSLQGWNGYHEVELEWHTQDDEKLKWGTTLGLQVWTKECRSDDKNLVTTLTIKENNVDKPYTTSAEGAANNVKAGRVGFVWPEATMDQFPFSVKHGVLSIFPK